MFPSTNAKNISNKCVNVNTPGAANNNIGTKSTTPKDAEAQWNGMLRRYDANGDGRLSRKELKAAFKSAGSSVPGWRAFRALRRADKNGDGFVEETELAGVIKYAAEKGYVL